MRGKLKILIVEDNRDDAEIIVMQLERHGYQVERKRVESCRQMQNALMDAKFDLIFSDHALPGFSSKEALEIRNRLEPDVPFILISGQITEEQAVEAMMNGCYDYVLKGNLVRLGVLVERALSEQRNRKQSEEKINYLAYYDLVTGLPNRTLFLERLKAVQDNARNEKRSFAVLTLELDNFKTINDTLGHSFGDRLLKNAGEVLQLFLREGDTLCRLGIDEFAILLSRVQSNEEAAWIAGKINELFRKPWVIDDSNIYTTVSIGLAVYPTNGTDAETLLKNADAAMYRAKELGRDNYQFFMPYLNEKLSKRLDMESKLRNAVENNEFLLHYQPQVDINTRKVVGVEALLRWKQPQLGMVSPMEFIPLAEETGLIESIGEWVLHTACRQGKMWEDVGLSPLNIAVNISARQLQQRDFKDKVAGVLKQTGLDSKRLELEITESTAIKNFDYIRSVLKQLNDSGINISLDDFGTGYSSLNYLKMLPINNLKIDKSFVHDLKSDNDEGAIAEAIISLAHKLRLTVTAEGIETPEQLAFLRAMSCDKAQGYLLSRPVTAEEAENIIRAGFCGDCDKTG